MNEFKNIIANNFSFNLTNINYLVEKDHIVYELDESGYVIQLYIGDDEYRPFPIKDIDIIDFIKSFKKLKELEICFLVENLFLIESLEPLNELKHLEKIDLCCNVNEFNIDFIRNMPNLKIIDTGDNPLFDIDIFKNNKELKSISIYNGNIKDISVISELVKLEKFSAPCSIQNTNAFKNCTELRELEFRGNGKISDISDLGNCKKLETLNLAGNKISNIDVLGKLSHLKQLYLSKNSITNIDALGELSHLKWLDLSKNSITNIEKLGEIPSLKFLYISDNPIKSIASLNNFNALESLVANNLNYLVVEDDFRIEEKSQLNNVRMSNCNLKNIDFISNLNNIVYLDLSNNQISEVGFIKLSHLNLANNNIKNVFPIYSFLNHLDLTGNPLKNVLADGLFIVNSSPKDETTKHFDILYELIANDFIEKNEMEGALAYHYYKSHKNQLIIDNIDHHLYHLKHLTSRNSYIADSVRRRLLGFIAQTFIFSEAKDRNLCKHYEEIINNIRNRTIDKPNKEISQKNLFFYATSQRIAEYDMKFRPTLCKLIEEEKMILNI